MQDMWMEKREQRERSVITGRNRETERDGVLETIYLLGARQLHKQQEETPFAYKHLSASFSLVSWQSAGFSLQNPWDGYSIFPSISPRKCSRSRLQAIPPRGAVAAPPSADGKTTLQVPPSASGLAIHSRHLLPPAREKG